MKCKIINITCNNLFKQGMKGMKGPKGMIGPMGLRGKKGLPVNIIVLSLINYT